MPTQQEKGGLTQQNTINPVLRWLSGFVVLLLTGLSVWAVSQVQIESHSGDRLSQIWYVGFFLICELWVAIGLALAIKQFGSNAIFSGILAGIIWGLAVGLSAYQEYRFHALRNVQLDQSTIEAKTTLKHAQSREAEIMSRMSLLAAKRTQKAIQAELDRYEIDPDRYLTKIAILKSEFADAEAYEKLESELKKVRGDIQSKAKSKNDGTHLKQLGDDWIVWLVIAWAMLMKSSVFLQYSRNWEVSNNIEEETTMCRKNRDGHYVKIRNIL